MRGPACCCCTAGVESAAGGQNRTLVLSDEVQRNVHRADSQTLGCNPEPAARNSWMYCFGSLLIPAHARLRDWFCDFFFSIALFV